MLLVGASVFVLFPTPGFPEFLVYGLVRGGMNAGTGRYLQGWHDLQHRNLGFLFLLDLSHHLMILLLFLLNLSFLFLNHILVIVGRFLLGCLFGVFVLFLKIIFLLHAFLRLIKRNHLLILLFLVAVLSVAHRWLPWVGLEIFNFHFILIKPDFIVRVLPEHAVDDHSFAQLYTRSLPFFNLLFLHQFEHGGSHDEHEIEGIFLVFNELGLYIFNEPCLSQEIGGNEIPIFHVGNVFAEQDALHEF